MDRLRRERVGMLVASALSALRGGPDDGAGDGFLLSTVLPEGLEGPDLVARVLEKRAKESDEGVSGDWWRASGVPLDTIADEMDGGRFGLDVTLGSEERRGAAMAVSLDDCPVEELVGVLSAAERREIEGCLQDERDKVLEQLREFRRSFWRVSGDERVVEAAVRGACGLPGRKELMTAREAGMRMREARAVDPGLVCRAAGWCGKKVVLNVPAFLENVLQCRGVEERKRRDAVMFVNWRSSMFGGRETRGAVVETGARALGGDPVSRMLGRDGEGAVCAALWRMGEELATGDGKGRPGTAVTSVPACLLVGKEGRGSGVATMVWDQTVLGICREAAQRSGVDGQLRHGAEADESVCRRIQEDLERDGNGFRAVRAVVKRAGALAACERAGMGRIVKQWWRGSGLLLERGAMRDAVRAMRSADGTAVVQAPGALMATAGFAGERLEMEKLVVRSGALGSGGLR